MTAHKTVLIIEDDVDIANVLTLHLRDENYEVVHSADGNEGLRLLEQGGWDALILDLMLPGVDGLEICRRARAMTRYTPIIITSARSSEVHRILGLELGADDYLAKPFSVLELVARVKALLRRVEAMAKDSRIDAGTLQIAGLTIDPLTRHSGRMLCEFVRKVDWTTRCIPQKTETEALVALKRSPVESKHYISLLRDPFVMPGKEVRRTRHIP